MTTMSTRATVYIHGHDGEMDIKLYHHWDGYVDYLGVQLEKALEKWRKGKMKDEYGYKSKNLIECIANVGGFEQAYPIHGDVEYVYHIEYGIKGQRNAKKNKYEHIVNYKLRCQSGMSYGEESILEQPKVLLCMRWGNEKKKLEPKKAELQLGNRDKFRDDYFKVYTVKENCDGEIFQWDFSKLEEAENRLNENVKDIDGKRLTLGFDNGTWSLHENFIS